MSAYVWWTRKPIWVGDIPLDGASLAIRYPTLPKFVKGMEIPKTGLLVTHKTRQKTKQGYSILPKSEKEKEIPKFLCWQGYWRID
jgi:hypothetical protein